MEVRVSFSAFGRPAVPGPAPKELGYKNQGKLWR